jgi:saccharopine dehydrogenase-like NADP-dependent oxidoreductase
MFKTLIAGAGTIGSLIATLLVHTNEYEVFLVDNNISYLNLASHPNLHITQLDVTDSEQLKQYLQTNAIEITISSLPYFSNVFVAKIAAELNLHYFDLTEDIAVSAEVRRLAQGKSSAFVSQCGAAPGFINIAANYLISSFDKVTVTHLRAGCLPESSHNALQYAIAWSLDGLINEYANTCFGLVNGQKVSLQPLEDLEMVELDGSLYEAFNTSGGVGSLVETYQKKVQTLNYKTLRYPGHCEKMRFLMQDLHLKDDRSTLKRILEKSLPKTNQDVMLLYVSVAGEKKGGFFEQSFVKKIHPKELYGHRWSAIQISTASSLCAVVDLVMHQTDKYQGFILQEQFSFTDFIENRFGHVFS